MNLGQNLQMAGGKASKDLLYKDLALVVPDLSYPDGFYGELQLFLFKNQHSFFEEKYRPPLLKKMILFLSEEDGDNLLTVLEGAKGLIQEYKLPNMAAYNKFMLHSKTNRFLPSKS